MADEAGIVTSLTNGELVPSNHDELAIMVADAISALEKVQTVIGAKRIRDKAIGLGRYAHEAQEKELEIAAAIARWEAERKAGELLALTARKKERRKGGVGANQHKKEIIELRFPDGTLAPTLRDLGITKKQSYEWQKLADLPPAEFKKRIAAIRQSCKIKPGDFLHAHGAHVGENSGDNEWYTPAQYITAARAVMGDIDLDPASTETANAVIGAKEFYSKDGQLQPWYGRVWMNPPYAQPLIGEFCKRIVEAYRSAEISEAVVLVNNATETEWSQLLGAAASRICRHRGRIQFWHPEKPDATPLQGQELFYFGEKVGLFYEHFKDFGIVTSGALCA